MKARLAIIMYGLMVSWLCCPGYAQEGAQPGEPVVSSDYSPAVKGDEAMPDSSEFELLTRIRSQTDKAVAALKSQMAKAKTEDELAGLARQINALEQQCARELLKTRIASAASTGNDLLVAELTLELDRFETMLLAIPPEAHLPEDAQVKLPAAGGEVEAEAEGRVVMLTKPSEPVQIESVAVEPSHVNDGGGE